MRFAAVLLLLFVVPGRTQGQSGRVQPKAKGSAESSDKDALQLRAEEVLLPVSVRTDLGKLPARLERRDFIVTEDGNRQQITSILRTSANIAFVLDTSGEISTSKNINVNRELTRKLIESLGDEDQAAVVTYGDTVNLVSSWTSDKTALGQALDLKFKPGLKAHFTTRWYMRLTRYCRR